MCVMCCEFLGTAEHNNLCSSCFRQSGMGSQPSQLCKNCGQFNGTAEKHFYCSSCYEDFIQLKGGADDSDARHEQQSTGSDSGNNSLDLSKYAVEMPEEDFVTRIPVSHNPQPPVPSLYHPFPVHVQDYTLGNPSLTNSYDRYPSGGYLHRVAEPPSQGGLSLGMDMLREHGSSSLHMVADSSGRSTRPHATLDTRQYTNRADNSRQHSGTDNTSRQHPKKSDYSRQQQGEYSRQQSGRGSYSKNYTNNHYHRDKSTKYSQSRYDSEDSGQYRQHPHPHSRTTWYASSTRDSRHGGGGGQNVCKRCQKLFPLQQGLCRICRAESSRLVTMNAVRSDVLSRCIRNGCNQSAASNKGLCSKCLSAERHHQPRSVNQKYTSMY
ncbi:hypothetical protein EB796_014082 [Bugula neritina]|uniref:A20-type domain-containing protein n=1 Tax=Bugula neritina TaxID=10212 RepID=A0A7J7JMP1_BUGNE|nr:hypothetical protein EB796_014082 [Bugula neritina]